MIQNVALSTDVLGLPLSDDVTLFTDLDCGDRQRHGEVSRAGLGGHIFDYAETRGRLAVPV